MPDRIEFFVPGIPRPWQRARRNGPRYWVDDETREWKELVRFYYSQNRQRKPLSPFRMALTFVMPRPKKHWGVRGNVLPSAPAKPAFKPDIDNLAKGVLDALNGLAYADDAEVVLLQATKIYVEKRGQEGLRFLLEGAA